MQLLDLTTSTSYPSLSLSFSAASSPSSCSPVPGRTQALWGQHETFVKEAALTAKEEVGENAGFDVRPDSNLIPSVARNLTSREGLMPLCVSVSLSVKWG